MLNASLNSLSILSASIRQSLNFPWVLTRALFNLLSVFIHFGLSLYYKKLTSIGNVYLRSQEKRDYWVLMSGDMPPKRSQRMNSIAIYQMILKDFLSSLPLFLHTVGH
mgnify:CR=1 FL=1